MTLELSSKLQKCSLYSEWQEQKGEYQKMLTRINETHSTLRHVLENTQHLSKLSALEDIRDKLLAGAIGRDHTNNDTVRLIVRILGAVIVALLFTLIFLLTGQKFNLFSIFHP